MKYAQRIGGDEQSRTYIGIRELSQRIRVPCPETAHVGPLHAISQCREGDDNGIGPANQWDWQGQTYAQVGPGRG
jgi:hypothetical protein